jgi:hypothetical protein
MPKADALAEAYTGKNELIDQYFEQLDPLAETFSKPENMVKKSRRQVVVFAMALV